MNLQNKKSSTIFFSIVLLLVVVSLGTFLFFRKEAPTDISYTEIPCSKNPMGKCEKAPLPIDTNEYAGIISISIDGQNIYTNKKYGFQLMYPKEFDVRENNLGYPLGDSGYQGDGEFGILDPSKGAGLGSITMSILPLNDLPDLGGKIIMKKQIVVAGQTSIVSDVEYHSSIHTDRLFSYVIPLQAVDGQYLGIIMYDDPSNFHVLDKIVKSITWLPVEKK
ncbi:MAG: hypothetical protein UY07_C0037G0007 [Parcubacteria group bacterium GW2011_GWA1_47_8]|nr:MAG: hypothetical protein UY07_C0037G0007 [Parcubacteria group bacterium GW2011_GWA1_47_8]KKW07953.1 MAG: hypothetical protein UY42_C0002G0002 [Parcubacteria group bacterium GW2011_GWA2_49_16]